MNYEICHQVSLRKRIKRSKKVAPAKYKKLDLDMVDIWYELSWTTDRLKSVNFLKELVQLV